MTIISNPPPSVAGKDGGKVLSISPEEQEYNQGLTDRKVRLNTVEKIEIPAHEGRAFEVTLGSVLRVDCNEGPQVGDMIVFNSKNKKIILGR